MAGKSALRGFVERIERGRGFVFVRGWAATRDDQALGSSLRLKAEGHASISIPRLTDRADLAAAGIADGRAGFAHALPYTADIDSIPDIVASTDTADEIVLSGPATAMAPFQPLGAFDHVAEDGLGGWLFDPAPERDAHLVVDGRLKLDLGAVFGRPDLPFEAGTAQLFGFFVAERMLADAAHRSGRSVGDILQVALVSSGSTLATTAFPVRSAPAAEQDIGAADELPGDDLWSPAEEPGLHIHGVYSGAQRALLLCSLVLEADEAVPHGITVEVTGMEPVQIGEPSHAVGSPQDRRLCFGVVVPSLPNGSVEVSFTSADGLFSARTVLEDDEIVRQEAVGGVRAERAVEGFHLLLDGEQADIARLRLQGGTELAVPLLASQPVWRFWNADGEVPCSFHEDRRHFLLRLRGRDPGFSVSRAGTRLALLHGGDVIAETMLRAGEGATGFLEAVEPDGVSGWLIDPDGDHPARYDVHINGVRYSSGRADRSRGDLARKGLSDGRGGFRLDPANPDPGADSIQVRVTPAFSGRALEGPDQAIALAGTARPHLDSLYAVLESHPARRVSVIVPIYNAAEDLSRCLAALVRNTSGDARLILIDDRSPDPAVGEVLSLYEDLPGIEILRNDDNLGFTRTVNRGIELAGDDDVVLLNSDTMVTPGWLAGLRMAAYSGPKVATATPLSNNAGVFSAPEPGIENALPDGLGVDDMGRLVRQASIAAYPRVPTGHGFCMFIRRDCLDRVGALDEAAFPIGYGEENDFCMRALRAGGEHVLDDRTFVYHRRSASFGAAKSLHYDDGQAVLHARYPEYRLLTRVFEHGADLLGVRWRIRRAMVRLERPARKPRPRVLFVISTKTGGTPQTNRDLMAALADRYEPWVLRCDSRQLELSRYAPGGDEAVLTQPLRSRIVPTTHRSAEYNEEVLKLLVRFGFELVHIRHLAWHGADLPEVCRMAGLPVALSFHDFYTACPSVKLLDENGQHHGVDCGTGGADCALELWEPELFPPSRTGFVPRWREIFGAAFAHCDAFVTTSERARNILCEAFPDLSERDFRVIPHGRSFPDSSLSGAFPDPNRPLRVLVPGNISEAKGAGLIRQIAALDGGREFEFHILGDHGHLEAAPGLVLHGTYQREEFSARVRSIRPHIGAVLSVWPETYCHTLTEMWACGLPVLGVDLGAVGERILAHGGGWLVPHGSGTTDISDVMRRIRGNPADVRARVNDVIRWQNGYGRAYSAEYMALGYDRLYRQLLARKQAFAVAARGAAPYGVAVLTGKGRPGEQKRALERWARNAPASERIFWHLKQDWMALDEPSVHAGSILVFADGLERGDGRRISEIASRRGLPLNVLMGERPATGPKSLFGPEDEIAPEDRTLFTSAVRIFGSGEDGLARARRFMPDAVPADSFEELPV
ncbi:glycosyltransferase [Terrihabitans sp. PJ23]|uniref:Glycosyltransferase n=2 Tax=Terrihabitans rhizophilus TaxID=3092662 RepID=A0ABU4RQ45_9HYPH|nr:glycosyltransferase [Terrihabitans sp. PJ23]MDX6805795.1 glycosyltransferase [Terrihabitans sp. PJ23]